MASFDIGTWRCSRDSKGRSIIIGWCLSRPRSPSLFRNAFSTGHIKVFRQHDHYLFDCTLPALWGRLPLPKSLHQPVTVTAMAIDDHFQKTNIASLMGLFQKLSVDN
jgi:hypothetical protein